MLEYKGKELHTTKKIPIVMLMLQERRAVLAPVGVGKRGQHSAADLARSCHRSLKMSQHARASCLEVYVMPATYRKAKSRPETAEAVCNWMR